MSINESILQIKLGDLKQLEDKVSKLTSENIRLSAELVEAQLGSPDALCRRYQCAFLDAMTIVRFAIGNMPPTGVRGWPHPELMSIAQALSTLPGVDKDQQETASDLKLFAKDCAWWEAERAAGTEQEALAALNAARAPIAPA